MSSARVRTCHGRECPCVIKRVKWVDCKSRAPSVVHLSVHRPRRGKWWHHLEHLGPERFERMRNGSSNLTEVLIETAQEMHAQGEWSRAFEYMRIVIDGVELNRMTVGLDSHVSFNDVPEITSHPAGPSGFRRLDPGQTQLRSVDVEQVVFFATNGVDRSDERLLRDYRDQLAGYTAISSQFWLLLMTSPDGQQPFSQASLDTAESPASSLGMPVFMWSERALHQRLMMRARAFVRF